MKCLVCGKNYEAAECPRCHFPDVQIVGDREKALEGMKSTIHQYKMNFLTTVKVSLVIYRWKDQNGQIVLDREEKLLIDTADVLLGGEKWLEEKFARVAGQKEITVTVCIETGDEEQTLRINVPNLHKSELQQLGASVDDDLNIRLLLRSDTGIPTMSKPVAMFAG